MAKIQSPIFLTKATATSGKQYFIGVQKWGMFYEGTQFSFQNNIDTSFVGMITADMFQNVGDRLTLANGSYILCTSKTASLGYGSEHLGTSITYYTWSNEELFTQQLFNEDLPFETSVGQLYTGTLYNFTLPYPTISRYGSNDVTDYESFMNALDNDILNAGIVNGIGKFENQIPTPDSPFYNNLFTNSGNYASGIGVGGWLGRTIKAFWGTNANTGVAPELLPAGYTQDVSQPNNEDTTGGSYPSLFENANLTPETMTGTISVSDMGGLHLYSPTFVEIQNFRNYMWSTPFTSFLETAQKLFQSPEEMIITLHGIPAEIPLNAEKVGITFGSLTSDTATSSTIKQQYISIDCGTISIPKIWGNFLDFEPYTKISLYLPYCSTIDLSANEVVGNDINIVYNIDVLTGDCVAQICVHSEEQGFDWIIATVQGNCALNVPWSSGNYSQTISDSMRLLSSVGMSTLSNATMSNQQTKTTDDNNEVIDNIGGTAPPDVFGVTIAPKISRGGTHSTAFGYLDKQKPYVLITRPIQSYPAEYPKEYGLPSNITETLENLKGFTVVDKITLQGIPATSDELAQIESALMSGVIIT